MPEGWQPVSCPIFRFFLCQNDCQNDTYQGCGLLLYNQNKRRYSYEKSSFFTVLLVLVCFVFLSIGCKNSQKPVAPTATPVMLSADPKGRIAFVSDPMEILKSM